MEPENRKWVPHVDDMVVEMLSGVTLTSEQQEDGANCDVSLSRLFSVCTQMYRQYQEF